MLVTLAKNITTDTSGPAVAIGTIGTLPVAISAAQGSVVTAGTIGTNKLDNTAAGYADYGATDSVAEVVVTTAFTAGGGFTSITVAAWTHSTTTVTSGTKLAEVTVLLANVGAVGDRISFVIPKGTRARYTGLVYTAVGANPGAGAVTADIVPAPIDGQVVEVACSAAGAGSAVLTFEKSFSGTGSWYRDVVADSTGTVFSSRGAINLDANTNRSVQYVARAPFIRITADVTSTVSVNATASVC
jgi:hypothetical protein